VRGVSLSAIYNPAESEAEVGGDWYDAFLIEDRTLVLSMGDVSGKGLDAAVLMSVVRQALRVAALESKEPTRTIASADRALYMEHPGHIVSAIVMFIDLETFECTYVNAGHPPPLLRCVDGTVTELDHTNVPLGVIDIRDDAVGSVKLQKDSLLVLYTDGLIESTRDIVEGVRRLEETLAVDAMVHTPNPSRLLYDTVLDREPRDDVAILTVSFGRSRHWSFDARDASRAQGARASFVRHLQEQGDAQSDFAAAEVIFGELTGNVVRYAPGPIDIDLEWAEEEPVLHVLDRGTPFSFAPVLPRDPFSENGRGLFIVQTLGKHLRVQPMPHRGNHVSITLPVRRRPQT
jgi:anti-sigma regulatory factor (Ser/Thr protein kinase)